jgi:hypothetical protein
MNNNGFFGLQNQNFNWGLNDSLSPKSSTGIFGNTFGITGAKIAGIAGGGISAIGSLIDIFAQQNLQNTISQQMQLADTQYNLQLNQIQAKEDISNTISLQRANQDYGNELARAGTTGIALSSGAIEGQTRTIAHNQNISQFNADVIATVEKMNTLFAKSSFYEQSYQKLKQSDSYMFGDFLFGGLSIAAALAIL